MGTLGGGNGGNRPPDGGNGLPGLPPEWGPIVVPDDLSQLAEESERVRRELRDEARRRRRRLRWRRLVGRDASGRTAVQLPVLLLAIAVFAGLTSLLTLGYAGSPRSGASRTEDAPSMPAPRPRTVPALDLIDADGRAVSLRSLLPAVILLTDGCACDELVRATARAAPEPVSVVVVGDAPPAVPSAVTGAAPPHALGDPAGELRKLVGRPAPASRPGVVLADRDANITHLLPAAESVEAYRRALTALARG
jgi:hypothetical protein